MMQATTNEILNRLLVIHHRSLPMYLRDAHPWMTTSPQDNEAWQTIHAMIQDHLRLEEEIAEVLTERGHTIDYGEFPIRYTAYHDLSIEFLLRKLIEDQERLIRAIESAIPALAGDEVARALAERALGAAKAHLENLRELKVSPTAA